MPRVKLLTANSKKSKLDTSKFTPRTEISEGSLAQQQTEVKPKVLGSGGGTSGKTKEIKFMAGDKVSLNGEIMTRQEYEQREGITPSGRTEILRGENGDRAGITLPDGRTFLGLSPSEVDKIAAAEFEKAATPQGAVEASTQAAREQSVQDFSNSLSKISQGSEQDSQGRLISGAGGSAIDRATSNPVVRKTLNELAKGVSAFSSFLPEFLQFGTKKSIGVQKAEQAFTDINSILAADVELLKSGGRSFADVEQDIQAAVDAIRLLEEEKKGLGKANLRYWIDEGAEIEAQILKERRQLENMQAALLQVAQTSI